MNDCRLNFLHFAIILLNLETLGSKHTSRSLLYVPLFEKYFSAVERRRYSLAVATLLFLFSELVFEVIG